MTPTDPHREKATEIAKAWHDDTWYDPPRGPSRDQRDMVEEIAQALAEAEAAGMERAAKIAESQVVVGSNDRQEAYANVICLDIAAAIRQSQEGG